MHVRHLQELNEVLMEERAELIQLRCSYIVRGNLQSFGLRLIYWLTANICFVKEGGCTAASVPESPETRDSRRRTNPTECLRPA
jgi:hypothetical protein